MNHMANMVQCQEGFRDLVISTVLLCWLFDYIFNGKIAHAFQSACSFLPCSRAHLYMMLSRPPSLKLVTLG
jgi:hypothetical protein